MDTKNSKRISEEPVTSAHLFGLSKCLLIFCPPPPHLRNVSHQPFIWQTSYGPTPSFPLSLKQTRPDPALASLLTWSLKRRISLLVTLRSRATTRRGKLFAIEIHLYSEEAREAVERSYLLPTHVTHTRLQNCWHGCREKREYLVSHKLEYKVTTMSAEPPIKDPSN